MIKQAYHCSRLLAKFDKLRDRIDYAPAFYNENPLHGNACIQKNDAISCIVFLYRLVDSPISRSFAKQNDYFFVMISIPFLIAASF